MTADACNVDNFVGFATSDDGSGLQRWTVTPTSVAAGTYQIINTGRSACTDVLDYDTCSQGNAVFMGTAGEPGQRQLCGLMHGVVRHPPRRTSL